MEFVHTPYRPGETIAAIATAPGEGGVAIVRICGIEALTVAEKILTGNISTFASHTAHYCNVIDAKGRHVDDVLVLPMLGRRSYVGEDTVEIHCHGGSLISRRVLAVALQAGARAALPGEFTFRAFMNGKLDLAQAEAVQELICAKNERALDAAEQQLQGALSQRIRGFQESLTHIAAILEAWVDFPEEGLEFATMDEVCADLQHTLDVMRKLQHTFHDGRILHDGLTLCLIGAPNVGKSSLMNALLDKERAIVSHIPGTTRDIVEDHLRVNGLNLKLVDTAGIRDSSEVIEQEGIRRSKLAMAEADLILLVLDVSRPIGEDENHLLALIPAQKSIAVWNKSDLPHTTLPSLPARYSVKISAKEKKGLDDLHQAIDKVIWEHGPPSREELVITNVRHHESLVAAADSCEKLIHNLRHGISPELLSADMRHCLAELGKIIGTNVTEDVLSAIFSKFCVGK